MAVVEVVAALAEVLQILPAGVRDCFKRPVMMRSHDIKTMGVLHFALATTIVVLVFVIDGVWSIKEDCFHCGIWSTQAHENSGRKSQLTLITFRCVHKGLWELIGLI
jgi:hypothetical protein